MSVGKVQVLGSQLLMFGSIAANTIPLDANTEALALKYYPHSTSPITEIDLNLEVTYDASSPNFTVSVESDSADAPSGTVLGAASAEFTHTADGFTGLKALATNTGNLTINVPVWLVLRYSSGTNLSATNFVSLRGNSIASGLAVRLRHHNGTNWTTTTVSATRIGWVVKHADGSYDGLPQASCFASPSAATDIYGDYVHGLRFKSGSQIVVRGIFLYSVKTGTPNALVVSVYEGDTLKFSEVVPVASIISTIVMPIWFSSPVALAADTNLYIILSQQSDGGTDSNDYDSRVSTFTDIYKTALVPTDYAFVYGDWSASGSVPSGLTVSTTDIPMMLPIIVDPAADFDQATGGGGKAVVVGGGAAWSAY